MSIRAEYASNRTIATPWAWLSCALPALLAFLVYLNALHNPFVFDDHRTILTNTSLGSLRDVRAILLHNVSRPIVNLSYAVDRRFWGTTPFGFHLTNLLLHVVNVSLLFLLAWRLVEDRQARVRGRRAISTPVAAFAAASLFAVHPMMTESVGYISGRSELLVAAFFLTAVLSARRWMLGGAAKWWLLTAGLWMAAMLAKEVAVMLPVVVFAYDRWVLGGDPPDRRRRLWRLHVPFAALTILAAVVRGAVFEFVEHPEHTGVRWQSVLEEVNVVARYVGLMLVPTGQAIFHELPSINRVFDPRALVGLGVVGLMVGVVWTARRKYALASFGVLWFLVLLLPSSGLFVLGFGEPMAEHRVYLASGGLFLAAGAAVGGLATLLADSRAAVRWVAGAVCVVELLSLSGRTVLRNAIWADPVALWREASDRAPNGWFSQTALGESLHEAGRDAEAVTAYREAVRLRPADPYGYLKLGLSLIALGRFDEAAATFRRLQRVDSSSTIVSTGLGVVAMASGDQDLARGYLRDSIARDTRDVMARQWLASLEEVMGHHPAEALRLCEEIQHIAPGTLGNDDCIHRNRATLAANGGSQ